MLLIEAAASIDFSNRVVVDIDEHLGPADINSILVQAGLRVPLGSAGDARRYFPSTHHRPVNTRMTLVRALAAEALKMKRTIALRMVVLASAIVVLLVTLLLSQMPSTLRRGTLWMDSYDAWRMHASYIAMDNLPRQAFSSPRSGDRRHVPARVRRVDH